MWWRTWPGYLPLPVCVSCLAWHTGISQATGNRYFHEGIGVLASQAPDLHEVLHGCREARDTPGRLTHRRGRPGPDRRRRGERAAWAVTGAVGLEVSSAQGPTRAPAGPAPP
jgi:hypothetical protein